MLHVCYEEETVRVSGAGCCLLLEIPAVRTGHWFRGLSVHASRHKVSVGRLRSRLLDQFAHTYIPFLRGELLPPHSLLSTHPFSPFFSFPSPTTPSSQMATLVPDGLPPPNQQQAQAQLNAIVNNDTAKNRVPVHTFNPDASPQQKGAAAGASKDKLQSVKPDKDDGGKGMPGPLR